MPRFTIDTALTTIENQESPDPRIHQATRFLMRLVPYLPPQCATLQQTLAPWASGIQSGEDAPPSIVELAEAIIARNENNPAQPKPPPQPALPLEDHFESLVDQIDESAKMACCMLMESPLERSQIVRLTQRLNALERELNMYPAEHRDQVQDATDGTPILATAVDMLLAKVSSESLRRIHHRMTQSANYQPENADHGLPSNLIITLAIVAKESAERTADLIDDSMFESPTHRDMRLIDKDIVRIIRQFEQIRGMLDAPTAQHPSVNAHVGEMQQAVSRLFGSLRGLLSEWAAFSTSGAYQKLMERFEQVHASQNAA